MYRWRSLLLCICLALSSIGVHLTPSTASAMGSPAPSPWTIDSLRLQKHDVYDPTGIHDLAPVIASGQYVYVEQYVSILRPIPASPAHDEFWIITGSTPGTATKVLFHHTDSVSLASLHPGQRIRTKIVHIRGLIPYPEGWRASRPYLAQTQAMLADPTQALPNYPLVTHRGGWPDGS